MVLSSVTAGPSTIAGEITRGRSQVLPIARASASAAPTPPRHGSPWPNPITAASTLLEPIDRRERLALGRERRRHHLHALAPGERVARAQHVADQQRLMALEVQCDAAVGVARRVDHERAAGDVEPVAATERRQRLDGRLLRRPGARERADRPPGGRVAEVGDQRGARPDVLRAGELLVGRVDEHRHVVLAADALGEADVIGVGVGEHERAHVGPGVAEPGEAGDELVVEGRDAGVDDRDAAGVLDDDSN